MLRRKFTPEQDEEILALKVPASELAARFGCTKGTIDGRRWRLKHRALNIYYDPPVIPRVARTGRFARPAFFNEDLTSLALTGKVSR